MVFQRCRSLFLFAMVLFGLSVGVAGAQEPDPERGARLFADNCTVCHGADAQGRVGPKLSAAFPSIDPNAFARSVIENGVEGSPMIAWSQNRGGPFDGQDVDDIVAFLESLRGGTGLVAPTSTPRPVTPIPTIANVSGDPTQGAQVYALNCAVCHGADGVGRVGVDLTEPVASAQPIAFLRQVIADGVDGSPMPAWGQERGGPLADGEIEDVAAFVLSLQGAGSSRQLPAPEASGSPFVLGLLVLVALGVVVFGILRARQGS
jgi:cytochrome c oxidase cbb3-type subunit III